MKMWRSSNAWNLELPRLGLRHRRPSVVLDARSPDHAAYRSVIDSARARYVPGLVLAELDYFLADDRLAMRAFVDDLDRRAFLYAPPTDARLTRAMHIDRLYARLGLGLVDATVVALAEELGIVRLATRDVRHFSVVRLADGRAFDLVVLPKNVERRRSRRAKR